MQQVHTGGQCFGGKGSAAVFGQQLPLHKHLPRKVGYGVSRRCLYVYHKGIVKRIRVGTKPCFAAAYRYTKGNEVRIVILPLYAQIADKRCFAENAYAAYVVVSVVGVEVFGNIQIGVEATASVVHPSGICLLMVQRIN